MKIEHRVIYVILSLAVICAAVFGQVTRHEFINFDDNYYVTDNPHVQAGLSVRGVIWSFTTLHANFWHPLTWLSHMLDCQFFHLSAGWHHLTALLIHIANTLLLFLLLRRISGAMWASAFAAALFAIHPLRVESVVWISERKDVLSTLFWFLSMLAYFWYAAKPNIKRYCVVLSLFVLGMMAKPMLMSLPFVFLLCDYWPLNRFEATKGSRAGSKRLILEKLPFLALATTAGIIAVIAQKSGGSLQSLTKIPILTRIANAFISYVSYIGKMFVPIGLFVPYPYPGAIALWKVIFSVIAVGGISYVAVRFRKNMPYLFFGWFWYVITLLPVSGLVQVGSHGMADRYTYVPLIGLFLCVSLSIADIARKLKIKHFFVAAAALATITALSVMSWRQAGFWKDSSRLFTRTLQLSPDNVVALNNMGTALLKTGDFAEAQAYFEKAIKQNPSDSKLYYNLGSSLYRQGKIQPAFNLLVKALQINPGLFEANRDISEIFIIQGNPELALKHLLAALKKEPDDPAVCTKAADIFLQRKDMKSALILYAKALAAQPDYATHYNMGYAFMMAGDFKKSAYHFTQSLKRKSDNAPAYNNLGNVLVRLGNSNDAKKCYRQAIRINPDAADSHYNLGVVLLREGSKEEAVKEFQSVLRIDPSHQKAAQFLAEAQSKPPELKKKK